MKGILVVFGCLTITSVVWGQCTISCSPTPCTVNWVNSPATCPSGGTITVPVGITLNFNDNGDTWTGTNIIVHGTLRISAPGQVTINSSLTIKSGGLLSIGSKLSLGSAPGCGYTINVETGGTIDMEGSTPDRLNICGQEVARGGTAGCNPYPTGPTPYCEPSGGFTGPFTFDEDGVQPVTLVFFRGKFNDNSVLLEWATSSEEDFDHFVVQHAVNGLDFSDVTQIQGAGYNTESRIDYSYVHTLPIIGANYYRLKAVDLNGTYEYFGPVAVRYNGARALWVHPNPASSGQVKFRTNFSANEGDRVQVYNHMGKLMADVPVDRNNDVVDFDEPLQPGSYILRYTTLTDSRFARFIVLK